MTRMLRNSQLDEIVPICRRARDDLEDRNLFPKRVKVSPDTNARAVAWFEDEILEWLEARRNAREAEVYEERRQERAQTVKTTEEV